MGAVLVFASRWQQSAVQLFLCSSSLHQTLQQQKQPTKKGNLRFAEKKQYNISGSASLHVIDSVLSLMWPRGGKILQIIFGSVFHLLSIMIYRKWVYFCVILIICSPPSSLPHIPLYCTSNFSLPSLSLCLPPLSPSLSPALPSPLLLNGG